MPIYDYQCECGKTRTVTLSIKAEEYTAVCACGKTMTRIYSVGVVSFKGAGFYSTDKGKK